MTSDGLQLSTFTLHYILKAIIVLLLHYISLITLTNTLFYRLHAASNPK